MVVTTEGINLIVEETLDSFDVMSHLAVGSGTTAPTASQTALVTETLRKAFESSTKTVANGTYQFHIRITLSELNSGFINEFAIFDASSGGNMAFRLLANDLNTYSKTPDDELLITLNMTVTGANA